ncbi:DNA topoisomerase-1 [Dysgonomonas sp. PH5-45]|uniref:type I DNA topoisomerase n=1 Tax=unclassified Dysgonomonas TaxID=2630389 RepID=UPI002476E8A8|nr:MULTISPECIES: type I DNA topoisomerase [unclassified Dysgonomonas]MDH6354041.1 DNA topoisomerase-1 [Dysgonomonas sp. PH5-45]
MQKNLVIVESPAKAKTIEKFLGKDFKVMSSYGHIRDLKKKDLGIDIKHNFMPIYEISPDKKKLVSELKSAAKDAEIIWLASDEDREGEAISWHLFETLGLDKKDTRRIAFHEITKDAILHAIENPRNIDQNLVDAQQARRILDRIVGFELSPVLWKKVKPALSAGRVQSVAVRLIVEREREIHNFKAESAYRIIAFFTKTDEKGKIQEIKAELNNRPKTKAEAMALLEKLKSSHFSIESIQTRPTKKSPAAPFTTSTLQQEASRKLGYSVSQTMMLAQKLYESGKITYMRTDSVNLSGLAINTSKAEISSTYGDRYVKTRQYATKSKGAQEAHEAIRPTYISEHETTGTAQEKKLYELIWKRTIASQMADAEFEKTTATINFGDNQLKFIAEGEVMKFDGFLHVYLESTDDEEIIETEEGILPPMKENEELGFKDITATQRFSQRPPRYTEASLVRKLEELGIGRPSTYAPTISTIQNREYVIKNSLEGTERAYNVLQLKRKQITDSEKTEVYGADKNKLMPTDIGMVVNDFLIEFFPDIMNYNFTANVEKHFDDIAEGNSEWTSVIDGFYKHFHPIVENAMDTQTERKVGERVLGTDPKTGKQVSVKIGRFGPMAQIGTQDEEEKPQFASLQKNQSLATITLNEALKLFDLPRTLGTFEDKEMTVAVGRFGPYVKHDNKFVSLPKTSDPYQITGEEAIELIIDKRRKDKERIIKTFEQDADMQLLNGRFGPYLVYKKKNYKLPKGVDPNEMTFESCMKIVEITDKKDDKKPAKKTKASTKEKVDKEVKTTTKKKTTSSKAKAK